MRTKLCSIKMENKRNYRPHDDKRAGLSKICLVFLSHIFIHSTLVAQFNFNYQALKSEHAYCSNFPNSVAFFQILEDIVMSFVITDAAMRFQECAIVLNDLLQALLLSNIPLSQNCRQFVRATPVLALYLQLVKSGSNKLSNHAWSEMRGLCLLN